jgi:hypothetical protein
MVTPNTGTEFLSKTVPDKVLVIGGMPGLVILPLQELSKMSPIITSINLILLIAMFTSVLSQFYQRLKN